MEIMGLCLCTPKSHHQSSCSFGVQTAQFIPGNNSPLGKIKHGNCNLSIYLFDIHTVRYFNQNCLVRVGENEVVFAVPENARPV